MGTGLAFGSFLGFGLAKPALGVATAFGAAAALFSSPSQALEPQWGSTFARQRVDASKLTLQKFCSGISGLPEKKTSLLDWLVFSPSQAKADEISDLEQSGDVAQEPWQWPHQCDHLRQPQLHSDGHSCRIRWWSSNTSRHVGPLAHETYK